MTDRKRLVWLDLETTGLNPAEGIILEYGIIITDLELNEKARKSWVLPWDRATLLENLTDDYVLNMHMANGLFKESHSMASSPSLAISPKDLRSRINREVRDFISRTLPGVPARTTHLAGSSIHFDRSWIAHHNPKLLELVSHRMLDVSSSLVAFPELFPKDPNAKPTAHRAIADLEASIAMHRTMQGIMEGSLNVKQEAE